MTRPTVMDKDRLAAFVDGELDPDQAAAVVIHLADHPQDQAYVDDLMAANEALAQAFGDVMDEPVPDAMRRLILGEAPQADVVPFAPKSPIRRDVAQWGALAGGLALAAGLAIIVFLPQSPPPGGLVPGPMAADDPMVQMLASLPSGQPRVLNGADVLILSSVPVPGGYCREIEVIDPRAARLEVGLACTTGAGWSVEAVLVENLRNADGSDGFATASGDAVAGLGPVLDRIGAGMTLSPEDEAAALARGWVD